MRATTRHARLGLLYLLIACSGACSWLPFDREQASSTQPTASIPGARGRHIVPDPGPDNSDESVTDADTTTRDLWRLIGDELRLVAPASFVGDDPLARVGGAGIVERASANAAPFLAHIHGEIAIRKLPFEIALIPIIESSYNPGATSPSGAAGIWQFMPATGRRFGLQQTRWYDGRRDVLASTRAALDYFEGLRDRFMGDWKLVFAAYNCGERTVERAIERNARQGKPTDFAALDLPAGTREYVPKLFALIEIIADPQAHGVTLATVASDTYFRSIDVGKALDLNRVIEWSGIEAEEFDRLNSGFRKRLTVSGAPSVVLLPPHQIAPVRAALAELPDDARNVGRVYIVKPGDTLSHIAASTAIPITVIKRSNRLTSNRLAVGQELIIPAPGTAHEADEPVVAASPSEHVVANGDTLWVLAQRYDTSIAALAAANGINRNATLQPGQRLAVPGGSPPAPAPEHEAGSTAYEVRSGDSLWSIAQRFKVTVADLRRWNALGRRAPLQPGQRLLVSDPQPTRAARDI